MNFLTREGAAIFVKSPRISNSFNRTRYNPQCFLQFSDHTLPPVNWKDHNVSTLDSYVNCLYTNYYLNGDIGAQCM